MGAEAPEVTGLGEGRLLQFCFHIEIVILYARMEALEAQKAEFETDAAKLRVAIGLRLTEKEVVSWLKTFRDGDPSDDDFRRRLVDIFINAVYVYDDRIIVFYNIRGGKQVSSKDLYEALESQKKKKIKKIPNPKQVRIWNHLASCADFDTKRKIKRQRGNWGYFSFGWVQNAQSKTGGDSASKNVIYFARLY